MLVDFCWMFQFAKLQVSKRCGLIAFPLIESWVHEWDGNQTKGNNWYNGLQMDGFMIDMVKLHQPLVRVCSGTLFGNCWVFSCKSSKYDLSLRFTMFPKLANYQGKWIYEFIFDLKTKSLITFIWKYLNWLFWSSGAVLWITSPLKPRCTKLHGTCCTTGGPAQNVTICYPTVQVLVSCGGENSRIGRRWKKNWNYKVSRWNMFENILTRLANGVGKAQSLYVVRSCLTYIFGVFFQTNLIFMVVHTVGSVFWM